MRACVHVNIKTRDLEQSIGFYSSPFGSQPTKVRENYANFRLDEPGLHLALVLDPTHAVGESDEHFGIELFEQDELDGWRGRLEQAGVSMRIEEAVTCCYAVANKSWVQDPDGNDWEFWVRSAEAEALHGEQTPAEQTGCCAPTGAEKPRMPLSTIAKLGESDGGCR